MHNVGRVLFFVGLVFAGACSGRFQKNPHFESGGLGYHRSLATTDSEADSSILEVSYQNAFEELEARESFNLIGSVFKSVNPRFDLMQSKYKKFSFLLFPKNHDILIEKNGVPEPDYENPILFQWEVLFLDTCQNIIEKENTTIRFSFFNKIKNEINDTDNLLCGVFQVEGDDGTSIKLYLDSYYRAYGISRTFTMNGKKKEIVDTLDPLSPLTSGLNRAPIDMPLFLSNASKYYGLGKTVVSTGFSYPENDFVKNTFLKEVTKISTNKKIVRQEYLNPCENNGKVLEYYNRFGDLTRLGWCSGNFMPRFIENQNFIALFDYSILMNHETKKGN